jgi:hypothetical protein
MAVKEGRLDLYCVDSQVDLGRGQTMEGGTRQISFRQFWSDSRVCTSDAFSV